MAFKMQDVDFFIDNLIKRSSLTGDKYARYFIDLKEYGHQRATVKIVKNAVDLIKQRNIVFELLPSKQIRIEIDLSTVVLSPTQATALLNG